MRFFVFARIWPLRPLNVIQNVCQLVCVRQSLRRESSFTDLVDILAASYSRLGMDEQLERWVANYRGSLTRPMCLVVAEMIFAIFVKGYPKPDVLVRCWSTASL